MTRLMTRRTMLATSAAAAGLIAAPAIVRAATTHEVQMLNQDPNDRRLRNVYSPRILQVMPGDTVRFLPTDKGHNSVTVKGMTPDGVDGWNGKINQEVSFTAETPGLYGHQCTPHAAVGMVGLIIVEGDGMMANLEAAQGVRQRGRAKQAWDEIWAEVAEMGLS